MIWVNNIGQWYHVSTQRVIDLPEMAPDVSNGVFKTSFITLLSIDG